MSSIRFNITLPEDVGRKVLASKNKSALIARSLRQTFEIEKQKALEKELANAYAKSASEDRSINADWDAATSDGIK